MPPLDEEYAAWPTCPSYAAMEAVFTMTPRWPWSSGSVCAICSEASARTLNVPTRLIFTTVAKRSRSCTPFLPRMRADGPMPAQFTTVRSGPAAAACSTAARTCSGSVTSVAT